MERHFQATLRGRDGQRAVVRDRLGRNVEDIGEPVDPQPGRDVTLSIDARLQSMAYQRLRDAVQAHNARSGSVVMLDAQTGEVLVLANYPSYDPERRRNLQPAQLRNRALTDIFEPGSTIKPFTVALAMEQGVARATDRYQTDPGFITITGSTIRDTKPHGLLTVAEIVQKSSNVGTVKLAMQMKPREMWEMFAELGIGRKPEIEFPGAATGRLRPYKTWRPIEQATMSYGYGLSASLLQLARAYTVFAGDGEPAAGDPAQARAAGGGRAGAQARDGPRGARDAADVGRPRRHRAQGAGHRLLGGRQDRHRAQAGGQDLLHREVPRLVRGPGARWATRVWWWR